ncbi:Hypothetical_protein [Hexamita inflata]|uniref:Hypothetical_protein n=1 Tax=Hexamita inflata TaxID=28002 RepID=A0ABP1KJ85_9EUKA
MQVQYQGLPFQQENALIMQILQDCRNGQATGSRQKSFMQLQEVAGSQQVISILQESLGVLTTSACLFIYFDKLYDICYQQVLIQLFNLINLIQKQLHNYYIIKQKET